jgi:hypothetical protein
MDIFRVIQCRNAEPVCELDILAFAAEAAPILTRLGRSQGYGLQRLLRCQTDFFGPRKTLHSTGVFAESQEGSALLLTFGQRGSG